MMHRSIWFAAAAVLVGTTVAMARSRGAEKTPAQLDTEYQYAVKTHDAATMDRILSPDFILVNGHGKVFNKTDLINEAHDSAEVFEHQEDTLQTVRYFGNTAVVTALLWEKGVDAGKAFDVHAWFSDTYVHTAAGWRYVFAQSSIGLPK